ncbi:MAG: 3-keto-5-aminohexanoate cleavage protein, partial [Deltaproteobacteria bacterium]
MRTPVIIEVAINGVTGKDRNPHVPCTPDEIANDALRCLAAGAAIVHNHIDGAPADGAEAAERYLAAWRPILAARPDAILYPTVGAGA